MKRKRRGDTSSTTALDRTRMTISNSNGGMGGGKGDMTISAMKSWSYERKPPSQ